MDDAKDNIVIMIGNAHLDPVWLWTRTEGLSEVISTMESAVRRAEEEERFVFTCSSACYYEFVKERSPALFEKIKALVREGRWNIVGGYWIQPDNNLISGEMYARHALYSQSFYKREFGITCKTGYCVDSFGHNGNLPQIFLKSGMKQYVFMRPQQYENDKIPNLFVWRGIDGSEVITYKLLQDAYNNFNSVEILEKDINKCLSFAKDRGHNMMCFYGVGNHGGGPTRRSIEKINELIERGHPIRYGGVDEFFETVECKRDSLPTFSGDLQHHAIGCYSVAGRIKMLERLAERELLKAEKFNFLAHVLTGSKFESGRIREVYKNVMFNNFHDIMCGCCIKEGLDTAESFYQESISIAAKIKENAIIDIAKNINTMKDGVTHAGKTDWQIWEENGLGVPLVLFNPNGFELKKSVKISRKYASCIDAEGKPVEIQYVKDRYLNNSETEATLFEAALPAFGYSVYWLYKDKSVEAGTPNKPIAGEFFLENDFVRVTFDEKSGGISSIFDKEKGAEIIASLSFIPRYMEDHSDTWSHNMNEYDLSKTVPLRLEEIKVIENGGVVGTISVKHRIRNTVFMQEYSLYKSDRNVHVSVKVNYCEKSSICIIQASTLVKNPVFAHEVPFGTIEKYCDGKEHAALRFAMLKGESSALGIVTDCKSSFSAKGCDLRFIAVRNSVYANHYGDVSKGDFDYTDEGLSRFNYVITLERYYSALVRIAESMDGPEFLLDSYHDGKLPLQESRFKCDASNVILNTVKPSEDGNGVVLRLYEASGKATKAHITFEGVKIGCYFKPFEVKTLIISGQKARETNFLEE